MTGVQGQGDGAVCHLDPDCIRGFNHAGEHRHPTFCERCHPAPPVAGEPSGEDGLAGVGAWLNHDDPVDEWPGIEEWTVEGIGAFLADAEDEYWSTYHRIAEAEGEDACGRIGSLYEALARRILTGPELTARLAAAVEQAKREAWERGWSAADNGLRFDSNPYRIGGPSLCPCSNPGFTHAPELHEWAAGKVAIERDYWRALVQARTNTLNARAASVARTGDTA